MACWFEYNGKRYEPDELVGALKEMTPTEAAKYIPGIKPTPEAPFKTSWHELAIKDALSDAVAAGRSRISWTPGEAQAARYDLSKHLSEIEYNPANGNLRAFDKDHHQVMTKYAVKPEELPDYIGKDAADRIVNNPTSTVPVSGSGGTALHRLQGLDLKVGGEFHKKLYDQKVPQVLNKIGKAHGVKVEKGVTGQAGHDEYKIHPSRDGAGGYDVLDNEGYVVHSLPTKSDAQAWVAEQPGSKTFNPNPVSYMDIPPSLADQIRTKGFSLFTDSGSAGAPLASLEHVRQSWSDRGLKHDITENGNTITVSRIVVPKEMREQGIGTAAMKELIDYADANGKRIVLSPSNDFGGTKSRLVKFYKGLDFVNNSGRNKDFTTRETMIREPKRLFEDSSAGAPIAALEHANKRTVRPPRLTNRPSEPDQPDERKRGGRVALQTAYAMKRR